MLRTLPKVVPKQITFQTISKLTRIAESGNNLIHAGKLKNNVTVYGL